MAYLGIFADKGDILREFGNVGYGECDQDLKAYLKDCKILLAWYGHGDYDGSAFVLFERDGKLYEVNGGHCSCFGLEGQWEPEETSVEALRHRINEGYLGRDTYTSDGVFDVTLKRILTRWSNRNR